MKQAIAFVISHESNPSRTEKECAMNIIALTLTRALGRKGVRVVRVHPNRFDDSLSSRYSDATEICPNLYDSEHDLTEYLLELGRKYSGKKILLPASDDCSLYMANHAAALSSTFVLLNPSTETMEQVRNKQRQYALASEVGVPIPETYFPKTEEEVGELALRLDAYPYIIKPLEAQKWRLGKYASVANGQKAITVHSGSQLIEEYRRIAVHDNDLMVQEIIGGEDEHLLTFLGYCSVKHKPLAYCIRSKLRQTPVDFGYCTATVTCHDDVVERYAKLLLNHCAYTGIVGIEFKFDPATNEYKLIEINTRPVNTIGIAAACGVDLPVIAYRDAIEQNQPPVIQWEDGVIWLRLAQDIAAGLELRRRGRLEIAQWFRSIRGKRVHAIFALDDLIPFLRFYYRFFRRQLAKRDIGNVISSSLSRGTRRWVERVSTWMF